MGKKYDFHYIIIGGGPAGMTAALNLSKFTRKKIAIVEGDKFGGAHLNSRDIPYAASLYYSHLYHESSHAEKFGITGFGMHFNFPTAINYQDEVIAKVGGGAVRALEASGITCINGLASFIDANHIVVGDRQYSAAKFIIATGARLATREISGTDYVPFLTPETALKIRRLPRAVCIVGGGATGCEIAQYFAELGIQTILVELSDRLLPREDKEVGDVIADYFEDNLGVTVLTNSRVVALEQDEMSKRVVFNHQGNGEKMVRVDTIVLATGSEPLVDYLGLENAKVKYKRSGIVVDKNFLTSAKNIYAIGDVIGGESSTDIASYQGLFLASNLENNAKNIINYDGYVRKIGTYPAVATVGYNEDDLLRRDRRYRKALVYLPVSNAAITHNCEKGFVKLLADKNNKLLGATIVAPNAEILIQELALAMRHRIGIPEIASTPHIADSFGDVIRAAAKQLMPKK